VPKYLVPELNFIVYTESTATRGVHCLVTTINE
jgi:hypothetical protein